MTKSTNTHSEYVTFTVFPRQQWLRERPSILRYTHIPCLVEPKIKDNCSYSSAPTAQQTQCLSVMRINQSVNVV